MIRLLLVHAALVAFVAGRTLPSDLVEWKGRIVGGTMVEGRLYPHQVSLSLVTSRFHFCGGALISDKWVLSAAHCTRLRTAADVAIWAGSNSRTSGGARYAVNRVINHEYFDLDTIEHDISLIEAEDIITGADVAPRGLSSSFVEGGVMVHVTGWGITENNGQAAADLQWLAQTVLTNEDCKSRLGPEEADYVHNSNICALGEAGTAVCNKDSGGPLVTANTAQTIVGIVSWGIDPCGSGFPDAYTRVSPYRTWIADHTGV